MSSNNVSKLHTLSVNVQNTLRHLPDKPGIYMYFDKNEDILYIGKAKSLKNRVKSYFTGKQIGKTKYLVAKICKIEYTIVETEQDALLLENNLVKEHQPPYNIRLKDDKTFPWICIVKETFPRVIKTRKFIKGLGTYFGPYTNIKLVYVLLELFHKVFKIRTCTYDLGDQHIQAKKYRVCMEYQIGNCGGPCVGKETETNYLSRIQHVKAILKGDIQEVIFLLSHERDKAAELLNFELAKEIHDSLALLIDYQSKSTVVPPTVSNVDVVGYYLLKNRLFVNFLRIIKGAVLYTYSTEMKWELDEKQEDILTTFYLTMQHKYQSDAKEVIAALPFMELNELHTTCPQKGDKLSLLELSTRNAKYYAFQKLKIDDNYVSEDNSLLELTSVLKMKEIPYHIECFDNSNIQGTNPASACVVFKNGKPSKADYRKFSIKTVEGPNDYASMYEVVSRRYKRLKENQEAFPQLIVIDGGKGQLSSAYQALKDLGLIGTMAIIGIAKRLEEIFVPGDTDSILLNRNSDALKLIQYMRNEAHRFSLGHHRTRRSNEMLQNDLVKIKGIGPNTYEKLIIHFKSIVKLKKASLEDIAKIIGNQKASLVFEYLNA